MPLSVFIFSVSFTVVSIGIFDWLAEKAYTAQSMGSDSLSY